MCVKILDILRFIKCLVLIEVNVCLEIPVSLLASCSLKVWCYKRLKEDKNRHPSTRSVCNYRGTDSYMTFMKMHQNINVASWEAKGKIFHSSYDLDMISNSSNQFRFWALSKHSETKGKPVTTHANNFSGIVLSVPLKLPPKPMKIFHHVAVSCSVLIYSSPKQYFFSKASICRWRAMHLLL